LKVVFPALLLAVMLAGGCRQAVDTTQPPEIAYGQDVCDNCNMLISEEKFAAAYWTVDGQARRFDDLGEMLSFMQSNPEEIASVWVHDVNSAEWLPAGEAYFVMNAGLSTPMGTGIVACSSEAEAQALAYGQDGAMVLSFDEILSMNTAAPMSNMPGGG
jgi:copper chaperone NosL